MERPALIITAYNRPEYLAQCMQHLAKADAYRKADVIMVDDASSDPMTEKLLKQAEQVGCHVIRHAKNQGICAALLTGLEAATDHQLIINLDADAIIRNDFFEVVTEHHQRHPDHIITGFYCNTMNKDGSIRHRDLPMDTGYPDSVFRQSVGGINMVFSRTTADEVIIPVLKKCKAKGGNWDHQASIRSMELGRPIVCIRPSVVEHIGIDSAMGHGGGGEKPDTADGFRPLHLPTVTLIGVDCVNFERLAYAAAQSQKNIQFAAVKLLTSLDTDHPDAIHIDALTSKEAYSRFMIRDIHQYIDTEHALVIQYDGYVVNHKAWMDEYLQYDYIGAPWWYKDGRNVGNGGFSLRSKRLQEALATDPRIRKYHPEDHHICRTYRRILERSHHVKFAPEPLARKFSIEGYMGEKTYTDQFGFHGDHIERPASTHPAERGPEPLVISQFQGIGDILFSMELVRKWIQDGHKVVWPVISAYADLGRQFPEITFLDMRMMNIDHQKKHEHIANGARVIPLRWSEQILKMHYRDVMKAKYILYGQDWKQWRNLSWVRDTEREMQLMAELGVKPGDDYILVNHRFRSDQSGYVPIQPKSNARRIEITPMPGYNMMDWALLVEHALEIHTVSTGILYMIDVLETRGELHQYLRKPDEKDFSFTDYLWGKEYHYHY